MKPRRDPAVRSSIFVGVEREKNLIRNDPDQSEFTTMILFQVEPWLADHIAIDKFRMLWSPGRCIEKYGTKWPFGRPPSIEDQEVISCTSD